ncbi:hypothetical protein [Xanthomonas sacchari]|uniref:hypothetical protein n=1 Tax=Xanthomonas sacchari TaxID=56458 RepID=UPI00225E2648|nr:hypothetical protein [Xanthomonas sacchari]
MDARLRRPVRQAFRVALDPEQRQQRPALRAGQLRQVLRIESTQAIAAEHETVEEAFAGAGRERVQRRALACMGAQVGGELRAGADRQLLHSGRGVGVCGPLGGRRRRRLRRCRHRHAQDKGGKTRIAHAVLQSGGGHRRS